MDTAVTLTRFEISNEGTHKDVNLITAMKFDNIWISVINYLSLYVI